MKHQILLKCLTLGLTAWGLSSCTLSTPPIPYDPYNPQAPYGVTSTGEPYAPYGVTSTGEPYVPPNSTGEPSNSNGLASTGEPSNGSDSSSPFGGSSGNPFQPYLGGSPPGGGGQSPFYGNPSGGSGFGNSGRSSDEESEIASGRVNPFPYDLVPDTITSLTCPEHVNISNEAFTLNAGAYYAHGLQLSDEFLDDHQITGNTPYQEIRQLLEKSIFKPAQARLALQNESNLNVIQSVKGRPPVAFRFPPLSNPSSLDSLSRFERLLTSRSTSSTNVQNSGRFRASLPITGKNLISWAPSLAQNTSGSLLLTVTYTLDGKSIIFNPETKGPYGRGYKLEFEDFYKANYLLNVREENLSTTRQEGEWVCPDNLRFMIHRATSYEASLFNRNFETYKNSGIPEGLLPEGFCYTGNTQLTEGESSFFALEFGVNQLKHLPFEVGRTIVWREGSEEPYATNYPCIKFRTRGCYRGDHFYRIEFDPSKLDECKRLRNVDYPHFSSEEMYKICPGFLSVCYRRVPEA